MEDNAEFYLAPISAGFFTYPDILDGGAIKIEHIAECVEAMGCEAENRRRLQEWAAQQPRS